jgi:hypothetical protein
VTAEAAEYLAEHIRIALAERGPHQMGLALHVDADVVRIRGPIDSEDDRREILRIVGDLAEGRRVLDDLELADVEPSIRIERVE